MTARKPGAAFERYLSKRFPDAASRERFDREVTSIRAVAQLVAALEASRQSLSLKKSELASRTGRKEPAVSRLLTSPTSNPTLKTWLEVLDAMDLRAEIRLRHRRRHSDKLIQVHAV